MNNPLLSNFKLPPFNKITNDCMISAIEITIKNCKKQISYILKENKNNYNWKNFCQPILELDENLYRIFSPISHLNYVCNDKKLRKIYEIIIKLITNYNLWIKQNQNIYDAYIQIKKNQNLLCIDKLQLKSINDIIHDFKLSGILLTKRKQKIYSNIIDRLLKLETIFNNNILDSTLNWTLNITDKKELDGIPEYIINIMAKTASIKNKKGYLISLDLPIYLSIITYCNNIHLRKKIYYAYATRATDLNKNKKWNNYPILLEELSLRLKLSHLLGYNSYTEQSLDTKSAKKIDNVLCFLKKLMQIAKKQAQKEANSLKKFVKKKYNIIDINPWDVSFFAEKYKYYLYGINDNLIRSYFPMSIVMNGMFQIVKKIYGLKFQKQKVQVWNDNVLFFDVFDKNNNLYGSIYFDLYIRSEKRNGAWMDICQTRMIKSNNKLQYPVAYVNCNFTPSSNNTSLLNHNEVLTLFHEFGHALHHIVSTINIPNISGINGIPLDMIEYPSQFMEYWCWEPKVLHLISKHYKYNNHIPEKLVKNLVASKKYNAALSIMRQIELSLFDIRIHYEFNLQKKDIQIFDLINEIRKDIITVVPTPTWNKYINIFNHIFGGGYAAGYYSYLWSEQLAADSFYFFKQNGLFNRKIGQKFFNNLLSLGNSQDILTLFKKFRGRELDSNSLLIQRGISP
ncbi:oligopeptidase A [Enterobacteriaceae endosymbiont of Donacia tomentosa]|uniref:M3 family metallopeptidase n=1 Tax=Enterobacteriaceae endosymbiont of Donacia tomentosa TaxID=2675787 RepID=UPI00144969C6|nr:M3 family metallopeptidase [Enterobacteriaceae endosymbiont of Donacia tomentosa]QJC31617.1 oligopeptidase A [Enterobacteriaceae endosymbiont of Donacia tomentosa]